MNSNPNIQKLQIPDLQDEKFNSSIQGQKIQKFRCQKGLFQPYRSKLNKIGFIVLNLAIFFLLGVEGVCAR